MGRIYDLLKGRRRLEAREVRGWADANYWNFLENTTQQSNMNNWHSHSGSRQIKEKFLSFVRKIVNHGSNAKTFGAGQTWVDGCSEQSTDKRKLLEFSRKPQSLKCGHWVKGGDFYTEEPKHNMKQTQSQGKGKLEHRALFFFFICVKANENKQKEKKRKEKNYANTMLNTTKENSSGFSLSISSGLGLGFRV